MFFKKMACSRLLSAEDLSRFRTKQCRRLIRGGCDFGLDRCQYSHNEYWNRRCPFYLSDSSFIRYIPVMCENVSVAEADDTIKNDCTRGGECPFAHSNEEILYHPLFYKTRRCEKYICGQCDTYYCPYVHGLAEARTPGMFKLPFTQGIDVPPLPGVAIVEKIEYAANSSSQNFRNNGYQRRGTPMLTSFSDESVTQSESGGSRAALPSATSPISHRTDLFQGFRRPHQQNSPSHPTASGIAAEVNILLGGGPTAADETGGILEGGQQLLTSPASNVPAILNSFSLPPSPLGHRRYGPPLPNHQVDSSFALPAADIITAKYMRAFGTKNQIEADRVTAGNVTAAVVAIDSQRCLEERPSVGSADSDNRFLKDLCHEDTVAVHPTDTTRALCTPKNMSGGLLIGTEDSSKSSSKAVSDEMTLPRSLWRKVENADVTVGQPSQKSILPMHLSSATCSTEGSASDNEDRVSQASGELETGSVASRRQSSSKTAVVFNADEASFLKLDNECSDAAVAALGSVGLTSCRSNSTQPYNEVGGSNSYGGAAMTMEVASDKFLAEIKTESEGVADSDAKGRRGNKFNHLRHEQTLSACGDEGPLQKEAEERVAELSGTSEDPADVLKRMKDWEMPEKGEQSLDDGGNAETGMAAGEVLQNLSSLNLALDVHAHYTEHYSATQWDAIACATYELLGVVELHRRINTRNTLPIWPLRNGVSFSSDSSRKSIGHLGPSMVDYRLSFSSDYVVKDNSSDEAVSAKLSPVFSTASSVPTQSEIHQDLGVALLPQDLSFALAWSPAELRLLNSNDFSDELERDITNKTGTISPVDSCLHYTFDSSSSLFSCATGCSEESDMILPGIAALSLRMKEEALQEGTV